MRLVRLTIALCAVSFALPLFAQRAAASRPDDDATALHDWAVPFSTLHRAASDALIPASDALPSSASHFIEMAPCRVYDSRVVAGGPGPIPSGISRTVPIAGAACAGVPASAAGFSLNFTVTGSASTGSYAFLTAYPTGTPRPNAATVNFKSGTQVGNAAIVAAGTFGAIDVYVSLQTEVIVDINGYFAEGVVTSVVAGTGLSGGGTGDVNVSIADGGVGPTQLSATGSTAGQVLTSNGTTVEWQSASGATGAAGGDLSGTYPNPAVSTVGGQSATSVANATTLANAATIANLPNTLVKRDGAGNFFAGTITAALNGIAATATNFSGTLAGEVTGTQGATVVSNAVSTNTANAIVRRDASGNFSAGSVTLSGNLALAATSSTAGAITLAGTRFAHAYGTNNTFFGKGAGNVTMTGVSNTGVGSGALFQDGSGFANTAVGLNALAANTSGNQNTAVGTAALDFNSSGSWNTAVGYFALTANTTATSNTAVGTLALRDNSTGEGNTAIGYAAAWQNVDGVYNTAIGSEVLYSNSSGDDNTALGRSASFSNTTGSQNTALGYRALYTNTTGWGNIAIGFEAGTNINAGANNIDIGNGGVSNDSATTRIGSSQLKTFIAGIRGTTTANANAVAVLIDSAGQLGTVSSSRRYKFDIADMADATSGLMRLRPVTFRYLAHGQDAPLQYGLIAEEVEEVYPELVARNEQGQPETVMYQFLAPMLLNEAQKEHQKNLEQQTVIEALRKTIDSQQKAIEAQQKAIDMLTRRIETLHAVE